MISTIFCLQSQIGYNLIVYQFITKKPKESLRKINFEKDIL